MKLRSTLLPALVAGAVFVPVAAAHVEISPVKVQPGSVARLTIEVPTERNVPTVKLEVKLASGVSEVKVAPKPGWTSSNQGGVITWSGGKIPPGQSSKFVFTAHMPDAPGEVLLFPAIQTYSKGPVVHWIGTEASDTPAPRVVLDGARAIPIGTVTLNSGGGHRGIAIAIGIAVVGAFLAIAVVVLRKRRA